MSVETPSLRSSAFSSGSLNCPLRAASKLASRKTWLTQTSMLLILSFAETSSDPKPILAQERKFHTWEGG
jgi:hypothetical protein